MAGANAGSSRPSRSASSAPSPESPPEHVRIPSPRPRGRAPRTASVLASSSRSCTSSAHAAPASRASARNTRWSPASAPVWAAAAAAPTADAPTFSTATPIPASAHAASASHSAAPSPASSTSSATERSSGSVARWASQSAVLTTVSFPDEIAVWRRSPRRVASALTTRLPLCEISPTCPGSIRFSASPQSAAREWSATSPSQFGPQTGKRVPEGRGAQVGLERGPGGRGERGDGGGEGADGGRERGALLAEAGGEDDRSSAPHRSRLVDQAGDGRGRGGDDDRVGRRREVGQRREAGEAVGGLAVRVDAPDLAAEAGGAGG